MSVRKQMKQAQKEESERLAHKLLLFSIRWDSYVELARIEDVYRRARKIVTG